ncbi:MAG: hypothetical protein PHC43_04290 [Candidatus Marinimicrobia bacterium]|nr:hypothetical protein [Candidatus Neomarinimicrobiota bacterium]
MIESKLQEKFFLRKKYGKKSVLFAVKRELKNVGKTGAGNSAIFVMIVVGIFSDRRINRVLKVTEFGTRTFGNARQSQPYQVNIDIATSGLKNIY